MNLIQIIPDSDVLTLRKERPSADSCEDPFQERHTEGFLPVKCGADAVFNFSWEKAVIQHGSGDDEGDDDATDYQWPITTVSPKSIGTTIIPTRSFLPTAVHNHTTRFTTASVADIVTVTPQRSAPRLPPRFTPSPENRHSSFQQLLRLHLNTFNQRLSMLESNTLDMKESIRSMERQQSLINSQLKALFAVHSATEKKEKVGELEKSHTDMEARLNRLERRLEILIDGFTALAQEMNKMKRTRHISRSPLEQQKKFLPPLTTALALPLSSTAQPQVKIVTTGKPLIRRATAPKSIPRPRLSVTKPTTALQRDRTLKPTAAAAQTALQPVKTTTKLQSVTRSSSVQVSTRSTNKLKTTLTKPRTSSTPKPQTTVRPEIKRPVGKRPSATTKRLSQPSQTRPRQVKQDVTITKFQLEPPSHKSKPARTASKTVQPHRRSNQANKKDARRPVKSFARKTELRSDASALKKVQPGRKPARGDLKKSPKPKKAHPNQRGEKKKRDSYILKSSKATVTTAKAAKAAAARKKPHATAKRTSTPAKKHLQRKRTKTHSGVVDLLSLLRGDYKSAKQKETHDGSLHVILGKLAIPIRIIPDD